MAARNLRRKQGYAGVPDMGREEVNGQLPSPGRQRRNRRGDGARKTKRKVMQYEAENDDDDDIEYAIEVADPSPRGSQYRRNGRLARQNRRRKNEKR